MRPPGNSLFLGLRRRETALAELLVLHQLDGHVAERLVREISRHVREVAGREMGLAVGQLDLDRRLALHLVRDVGLSQRDEEVIVPVTVQQRGGVGRHLDLEDPDLLVFDRQVMRGLGRDLHLGSFGAHAGQRQADQQRRGETERSHHASLGKEARIAEPVTGSRRSPATRIGPGRGRGIRLDERRAVLGLRQAKPRQREDLVQRQRIGALDVGAVEASQSPAAVAFSAAWMSRHS